MGKVAEYLYLFMILIFFFFFFYQFIYPFVTQCIWDWAGEGSKPTISPFTVTFIHSMKLFVVTNMYFQTKTNINITYEIQKCFTSGWAAIKLPPAGGTASGVREGRPASLTHNISRHTKLMLQQYILTFI